MDIIIITTMVGAGIMGIMEMDIIMIIIIHPKIPIMVQELMEQLQPLLILKM